jgi:hypothetical protein
MPGPSHHKEQAERRDVLRNEQKLRPGDHEPTTFSALAGLDTSLDGRFAPGGYVSGSEQATEYPRLPEASPWSGSVDPGVEQPLGVSIDQLEPTGTAAEIEHSLAQVAAPAASFGSPPAEVLTASSASERMGAVPSLSPSGGGTAPTSAKAQLAEILPRLARPTIRRRKA